MLQTTSWALLSIVPLCGTRRPDSLASTMPAPARQRPDTDWPVDRLYGFDVSNLLWRKLGGIARSAGRVQSVAVRKVVQRERERIAFKSATYWDLLGAF